MAQVVDLGYRARRQFVDFHKRKDRWAVVVAHRRCGKTVACIADLIDAALRCQKPNPRFAYIAPMFTQAKDVAFQYLKDMALRVPGTQANESELRVDFPTGARIRLYGVENADRLRGLYLDGVVLDEYADMDPRAWPEVIRPALSDRQGYGVFIGTPRGRNAFWEVWEHAKTTPNWYNLMLRASETGLIAPAELADLKASLTPETFEQELECSFEAAILGAYYGKEITEAERAGRIRAVPYEPDLPVHVSYDLGIGDSTALWFFQIAPDGIRFIDFYESNGQPLTHYAGVIASKPYKVETDWLPHDSKVRELGTGLTRVETLKGLGRNPRLVPNHKLEDGINAARVNFHRMWFDDVKCRYGLECLRQYQAAFDEKKKVFTDKPLHNWTSHASDAFRYAAMAFKELQPEPAPRNIMRELLRPKTFNEVLKEYDEETSDD